MESGIIKKTTCRICGHDSDYIFNATILKEYTINYFHCPNCGFLQTEVPYWLEEAYKESINISDTGLMSRNINLSKITSQLIYFFFEKNSMFLDYAGGYGIFTRLMRDIGFDFYWTDKYCMNLVAKGFEHKENSNYEILTSFEVFEHLENPTNDIENMLKVSRNILFTTELISDNNIPRPNNWWYFGLEHGQHISFYSKKTLQYLAKKYKLNIYSNNSNIHLLTEKKLNQKLFKLILKLNKFKILHFTVKRIMKSKTIVDMNYIINQIKK